MVRTLCIRVDMNSVVRRALAAGQKGSKTWDHGMTFQRSRETRDAKRNAWESQAARGPEHLGSQMGGPNRMPSGCRE